MATTVTASDLTVTVNDSLTLNGVAYGGSTSKLDSGCNEVVQRVVKVALEAAGGVLQTWTTLFNLSIANNAGTGIKTEFQYARITNLDNLNYITLQFDLIAANQRIQMKLQAGESYIVNNSSMTAIAAPAPVTGYESFSTLEQVRAAANTAAVDVEILFAFKSE